jgi:tripartite-type tricarboxylate transporter receptor subunit TctC
MIKAQTLPSGPIRIIVGFPPGGGTDALARVVAQKLTTMWNTSIVIDNKAGAAGVIAADFTAKQPSDGNTLLMAHINSPQPATQAGLCGGARLCANLPGGRHTQLADLQ